LTPAGRRAFSRAARVHLRGIQEHFGRHLTDEQVESLRSLLEPLLAARCQEKEDEGQPAEARDAPVEARRASGREEERRSGEPRRDPSRGPGLSDS
ncbi:MAG: hypothetical protein LBJ87_05245, partial [bacterium]|nr:hypothetical protein [bacterium]